MDSLLGTLVVLLIMAASSWIQKKAESQQRSKPPVRPRPPQPGGSSLPSQPPPSPVRKLDWQEELRRMLEGDEAPPVQAPPVVAREQQSPAPPPIVIVPKPKPRPIPVAAESEEGPRVSRLAESIAAYKKAQQLQDEAAARLEQTVEQTKLHKLRKVGRQREASKEIESAISLVRNPASVRKAVVASIVLGPPKGLEN